MFSLDHLHPDILLSGALSWIYNSGENYLLVISFWIAPSISI
jgi:hypothetical protein